MTNSSVGETRNSQGRSLSINIWDPTTFRLCFDWPSKRAFFGYPALYSISSMSIAGMMMMICFDRYYKSLIRTKATSPISLPARQVTY